MLSISLIVVGVNKITTNDIEIKYSGAVIELELDTGDKVTGDMVVLASAMIPNRRAQIFNEMLMLNQDDNKFFVSNHKKMDMLSTPVEGIFVVGAANFPKDISRSIVDGSSAAGKVMSRLIPGQDLEIETLISTIDEEKCSGCKTCIVVCPYKAIGFDSEKGVSYINEVLCRGCGTCVATCPS